jgi:hypothetical protein
MCFFFFAKIQLQRKVIMMKDSTCVFYTLNLYMQVNYIEINT